MNSKLSAPTGSKKLLKEIDVDGPRLLLVFKSSGWFEEDLYYVLGKRSLGRPAPACVSEGESHEKTY